MVAASSSSSDDELSLGADQEIKGTYADSRCCFFQCSFIMQRHCAFIVESIHPPVPGTLEKRPFNISLFRF